MTTTLQRRESASFWEQFCAWTLVLSSAGDRPRSRKAVGGLPRVDSAQEGAHGQGPWTGGAAQRHLSTFTAASTQPSSRAICEPKSGCGRSSCERGGRVCDSIVRLQPDDSRHHAGGGSGCCQRRCGSSEIIQASRHYGGGGGGCCSCARGDGGRRDEAHAPRPTVQSYRPPRRPPWHRAHRRANHIVRRGD